MQLIILLPSFLLFLYVMYRLIKDDYVFIRKNISLEYVFDLLFISGVFGLFFARFFFVLFHIQENRQLFSLFFSPQIYEFSFFGAFIGGAGFLYLVGKYKKLPIERFFDFFTLAFVCALPIAFVGFALFAQDIARIFLLGNAFVYGIFAVFCLKYVYPKLSSRELKEGNVAIIFLFFFAVVLLINTILLTGKREIVIVSTESIVLFIFLLVSVFLFIRQNRRGFLNKKR